MRILCALALYGFHTVLDEDEDEDEDEDAEKRKVEERSLVFCGSNLHRDSKKAPEGAFKVCVMGINPAYINLVVTVQTVAPGLLAQVPKYQPVAKSVHESCCQLLLRNQHLQYVNALLPG